MDLRVVSKNSSANNNLKCPSKASVISSSDSIGSSNEIDAISHVMFEKTVNTVPLFSLSSLKNNNNYSSSSSGTHSICSDGEVNSVDEDLTSLSWLHNSNLLQNFCKAKSQKDISPSYTSESKDEIKPISDVEDTSLDDPCLNSTEECTNAGKSVPYNPLVHVNTKPPYSFSCLIFMAIEESPHKALPVKEIYSWIVLHFPYFRHAPIGWKNSVRHNLSLNKCFCKVDKDKRQNMGKGSLWCVDAEFRPNLLQALRRAPLCPFSECHDKNVSDFDASDCDHISLSPKNLSTNHSRMPDKEADVASTMLNLKNSLSSCIETDLSISSKERKRKRYLKLGLGGDFTRSVKKKSNEDKCEQKQISNKTSSADHTYSASNQEHGNNDSVIGSPQFPKVHIIYNEEINAKANTLLSRSSEVHSEESVGCNTDESNDSVISKSKCSQSVIVDGSKLKVCVKEEEEEEERSAEEGAQALLSLANIARMNPKQEENKPLLILNTTTGER